MSRVTFRRIIWRLADGDIRPIAALGASPGPPQPSEAEAQLSMLVLRGRMRRLIAGIAGALLSMFSPHAIQAQDGDIVAEFHDAVEFGDVSAVRKMLSQDPALASSGGRFGFQPMQLQNLYFEEEILDLLLANGADINSGNDDGVTLLHIIADADAVPTLIAKGADLEARDIRGWTPLIMQVTSQENGPDVVMALLKAGADRQARAQNGQSALDLVMDGGADPELIRLLQGR